MHTEVQPDAAVLHTETVLIDAPVTLIYDIICDAGNWPEWMSSVNRVSVSGVCTKGREFQWHSSGLKFKSLVHTAHRPLEFGWVAKSMWFKIVYNWTLEPFHDQTRVIVEEGINGLGSELMRNTIRNTMQLTLMELKKYAEARVPVNV